MGAGLLLVWFLEGGMRWLFGRCLLGRPLGYTYGYRVSWGCLLGVEVVVFGVWVCLWGRWRGSAMVLAVAVTVVESSSSRLRAALWVLSTPLRRLKGCGFDEKLCCGSMFGRRACRKAR